MWMNCPSAAFVLRLVRCRRQLSRSWVARLANPTSSQDTRRAPPQGRQPQRNHVDTQARLASTKCRERPGASSVWPVARPSRLQWSANSPHRGPGVDLLKSPTHFQATYPALKSRLNKSGASRGTAVGPGEAPPAVGTAALKALAGHHLRVALPPYLRHGSPLRRRLQDPGVRSRRHRLRGGAQLARHRPAVP